MKKKTFIVQLLDSKRPNRKSFTQVEDANFYSNDTDASLVFIPHEDTFDFQSAKVVMYNRGDESLVERDMVVTTEDGRKVASYELPDEIISHWGDWTAQPVFSSDGEIYSGSIVPFLVFRYLMHERPPKLSEIVTVTKFLEQSQQAFDEMAESESDRVLAEAQRQTSVSQAITTLTTTNQNVEEAETQRASAESGRASAEEQRKLDHANRSAELAGKADKVIIKNDVKDPNFNNGLVNWSLAINTEAVVDGNEVAITTTKRGNLGLYQDYNQEGLKYISAEFYSEDETDSVTFGSRMVKSTIPNGVWTRVSSVSSDNGLIRFYADSGEDFHYKMRKPTLINLTQIFGAGNEPTKEEMDRLIKVTGHIDGEYALNNKEMLGYLMEADKVVLENKLVNPTFSNGLDDWSLSIKTEITFSGNEAIVTTTEQTPLGIYQRYDVAGLKYISAEFYSDDGSPQFRLGDTFVNTSIPEGVWSRVSHVGEDKGLMRLYAHPGSDYMYKIRNPIVINLTQTFGAGNEPAPEEMDELIKVTGYIDGEYALNNKEMLIWTLALIRRNKNAIITLGGA